MKPYIVAQTLLIVHRVYAETQEEAAKVDVVALGCEVVFNGVTDIVIHEEDTYPAMRRN